MKPDTISLFSPRGGKIIILLMALAFGGGYSTSVLFQQRLVDFRSTIPQTSGEVARKAGGTITPTPVPTGDPHGEFIYDNMLIRVNEARLARGLNQLYTDDYLSSIAQKDLKNNCPVVSHENFRENSNNGSFKDYDSVAENLSSGLVTPKDTVDRLLTSPTHADIMIGQSYHWTHIGIGIVTSPVNCVSLIFGR